MNDLTENRIKELKKQVEINYKLLAEYEQGLILTDSPKKKVEYELEIKDLRQRVNSLEAELKSINKPVMTGSEEDTWQDAMRENTLVAYQSYLEKFPNGKYIRVVQKCIESIKNLDKFKNEKISKSGEIILELFSTGFYDELIFFHPKTTKLFTNISNVEEKLYQYKFNILENFFKEISENQPSREKEEVFCFNIGNEMYYSFLFVETIEQSLYEDIKNQNPIPYSLLKKLVLPNLVLENPFENTYFDTQLIKINQNEYLVHVVFSPGKVDYDKKLIDGIVRISKSISGFNTASETNFIFLSNISYENSVQLINSVARPFKGNAIVNKFYTILIELFQNILQYSDLNKEKKSLLKIEKQSSIYLITATNFIASEDIDNLLNKIDFINSLTEDEVDAYYDYCLYTNEDEGLSVGLSLAEIRRLTNNQIIVQLLDFDEESTIVLLTASIEVQAVSSGVLVGNESLNGLFIDATDETPGVNFDPENNLFSITGRSVPEDAVLFYKPLLAWLQNYLENEPSSLNLSIQLEYYNTASSKQILKLLLLIENSTAKENTIICWHYNEVDLDALRAGERLSKLIKLKFNLLKSEDNY